MCQADHLEGWPPALLCWCVCLTAMYSVFETAVRRGSFATPRGSNHPTLFMQQVRIGNDCMPPHPRPRWQARPLKVLAPPTRLLAPPNPRRAPDANVGAHPTFASSAGESADNTSLKKANPARSGYACYSESIGEKERMQHFSLPSPSTTWHGLP